MKKDIMTFTLALSVIIGVTFSCSRNPVIIFSEEDVIGEEVSFRMIGEVRKGDYNYTWLDFRIRYPNISLVYLQDGCGPCYHKFVEWHKRMAQIRIADDYTVLFVINSKDFASFASGSLLLEEIEPTFYYFIDPMNSFLRSNSGQSENVINRSLLIDKHNRIKMVGEPFANADMTKVFHIVTGVDIHQTVESK